MLEDIIWGLGNASVYKYRLLKVLFRPEHNGTSDVSLYLAVSLSRPFC